MRGRTLTLLVLAGLGTACSTDRAPISPDTDAAPTMTALGQKAADGRLGQPSTAEAALHQRLIELAARVEADVRATRPGVAAHAIHWAGDPSVGAMGGEIFFNDRGNKRLGVEWVPGDPRRLGRNDIGYAVFDGVLPMAPPGLAPGDVEGAIDRAMSTWATQACSPGLEMPKGTFLEWVFFERDILHAGFEFLPPGVLGVTLPFVFTDGSPDFEPTDIDGNGAQDYAFAVILYAVEAPWGIDDHIDLETVALHEGGHGLGQAHFGKGFLTPANGKVHFAPRALMNAAYTGIQQTLLGTDAGGHCGLFGNWPN